MINNLKHMAKLTCETQKKWERKRCSTMYVEYNHESY